MSLLESVKFIFLQLVQLFRNVTFLSVPSMCKKRRFSSGYQNFLVIPGRIFYVRYWIILEHLSITLN